MKYKILCSDLDGTLLSTKSDVSEFTIAEIFRIKKKLKIILVSARMPNAMTYLQQRLGIENMPLVCYNGALIMDGSTHVFSTEIPIKIVESLDQLAKEYKIKLGLYHNDEWYTSEDTEFIQKEIKYTRVMPIFRTTQDTLNIWKLSLHGAHKMMLMGTNMALDSISNVLRKEFDTELLCYRSNDILIEVAPKGTSKLLGIKKLLADGQTLEDVVAFGDNYNDIEMLQGVGCGVAVGNAIPEVKAIADKITLKNTEDGVAHFLKQHLST